MACETVRVLLQAYSSFVRASQCLTCVRVCLHVCVRVRDCERKRNHEGNRVLVLELQSVCV